MEFLLGKKKEIEKKCIKKETCMIFPSTIVVKTFKHFGKILGGGWGKRRQAVGQTVSVKVRFIFCALPQSDEKGVWLTTKALPMIPPLQYIPTSQPTLTHS